MNRRHGRIKAWTKNRTNEWNNTQINGCKNAQMNEWMNGRKHGWRTNAQWHACEHLNLDKRSGDFDIVLGINAKLT